MHFGRFFRSKLKCKIFLDTYLPSPVNICPSKSMAILKVGIWTGPLCSSSLYSNPGLNSFKAKHGFFKGWKALLFFFFFFPLFVLLPENNSGKCMLGTVLDSIVFKLLSMAPGSSCNTSILPTVLLLRSLDRSTTNRSIIPISSKRKLIFFHFFPRFFLCLHLD